MNSWTGRYAHVFYKAVHITSTSRTLPAAIENIDSSEWLTVRMTANLNSELGESSTDVSHDNLPLESVFISLQLE